MNRLNDAKPLRIGVVGLRHGTSHVRTLTRQKDFQLVAICDRAAAPLARAAKEHATEPPVQYEDYDQMLADAALDAVVIATPVQLHEPMAVTALRRGIHVLLEKPMAHDVASAVRIKEAADECHAVLQIGFEFRSSPLIGKIHQIIESGELGQVVIVWTRMFRGPASSASEGWRGQCGLFFDCMIHEIDGLMAFAGADFERVAAFGAPQGMKGLKPAHRAPETVTACIEFDNAVRGSLTFSELQQTYDNTQFGIVGDRGRIDASMLGVDGAGAIRLYTHHGLYRTTIDIDGSKTSRGHIGFDEQYRYFAATIRQDAPNISDVANGLKVQRIMAAFEMSMNEGCPVQRRDVENVTVS